MSTIIVNGKKYTVHGNNVNVINDKIYVDGKLFTDCETTEKTVNITIMGDVNSVKNECGEVKVTGKVMGDVSTMSGDIDIASEVGGSVTSTSGDIKCGNVKGNAKTVSGDINCAQISGSASSLSGNVGGKNKFGSFISKFFEDF